MFGVWSYLRQFTCTKWVIVVDDDIDPQDWKGCEVGDLHAADPARDITVVEGTGRRLPGLRRRPESGLGSKIGLAAVPGIAAAEDPEARLGHPTAPVSDEVVAKVDAVWADLGAGQRQGASGGSDRLTVGGCRCCSCYVRYLRRAGIGPEAPVCRV